LSEKEALHEAKRCLSCGNCFECDNCYAACPEDAIAKLGPDEGYQFNSIFAPVAASASSNALPRHGNGQERLGQDMNAVIKLNAGDSSTLTSEASAKDVVRTDHGRQYCGRSRRLSVNEVLRHLSDHPSSTMASLQINGPRKAFRTSGAISAGSGNAKRGRRLRHVHGALQSGAMTTTFTSSQGLMLCCPI